jgi:hypothetical protein
MTSYVVDLSVPEEAAFASLVASRANEKNTAIASNSDTPFFR